MWNYEFCGTSIGNPVNIGRLMTIAGMMRVRFSLWGLKKSCRSLVLSMTVKESS